MKKWISALCSAIAGVLSIICLSLPAYTRKSLALETSYTGWQLLTDETIGKYEYSSITWYRFCVWAIAILAVVLILLALLQILANLKIIKMSKNISSIANLALIAIAVVAIGALVANFGFRADRIEALGGQKVLDLIGTTISVGISLWAVMGVNVLAAVLVNLGGKKAK